MKMILVIVMALATLTTPVMAQSGCDPSNQTCR